MELGRDRTICEIISRLETMKSRGVVKVEGTWGSFAPLQEGKQYTGKEVLDILSADGRKQKTRAETAETGLAQLTQLHEALTTQYNDMAEQVKAIQKTKDDAELEKVKDDPVALGSLQARQANAREAIRLQSLDTTIKAREAKAVEKESGIAQQLAAVNIKLAALTAGVDEAQLAEFVPDGDPKRLASAVKILKAGGVIPPPGGNIPQGLRNRPASTVSAGGIGDLTPDEKITRGLAQKKK